MPTVVEKPIVNNKLSSNKSTTTVKSEENDVVQVLKNVVGEITDANVIWKVVREKILSQCQIWDLLMDKACFRYIYDNNSPYNKNDDSGRKKFSGVVAEMTTTLGEFKCFMDGCLTEAKEGEEEKEVILGPELERAYDLPLYTKWRLKEADQVNPLFQHFFSEKVDLTGGLAFPSSYLQKYNYEIDGDEYYDEEEDEDDDLDEDDDDEDFKYVDRKGDFKCPQCPRFYTRPIYLKKHLVKCTGKPKASEHCEWRKRESDGRFVCDVPGCTTDADWNASAGVWAHFQAEHALPEDLVFACDLCQERFVHQTLLSNHMKENHDQSWVCDICGKRLNNQTLLSRHKKSHKKETTSVATNDQHQFKCDLCDFSTNAMNGLSLHKRRLHRIDKNNRAVTTVDNPDFHKRDPKKFKHECRRCTRRYKKIHHLERHMVKCDGIPPPIQKPMWRKNGIDGRFSCAVPGCGSSKTWTSSFSVWHHFNAEHADMQDDSYCVFKCDMCDKKFPNKSMLTRHRNHKHESLFRFQCSVCAKRLASNKLLKLHMTQHTGEKPFGCDLCEYRAITQSIVNQHKMRMHEGSMPHKVLPKHVCEICGKSFKVRSNLKEHMQSHSDARTFLCGFCGKALKNRQCLNRHLFTHGVKHTCQVCGKNFANPVSLNIHRRDKHGMPG